MIILAYAIQVGRMVSMECIRDKIVSSKVWTGLQPSDCSFDASITVRPSRRKPSEDVSQPLSKVSVTGDFATSIIFWARSLIEISFSIFVTL